MYLIVLMLLKYSLYLQIMKGDKNEKSRKRNE